MPLSDDELKDLELHADLAGFESDTIVALIAELRAARKVVEAARSARGVLVGTIAAHGSDTGKAKVRDVLDALAEYDALSTPEPQEQPA